MSLFRDRKKSAKPAQGRRPADFKSIVLRISSGGSGRRVSTPRLVLTWAFLAALVAGLGVLSVLGMRFVGHALFDENELFSVAPPFDIKTSGDVIRPDLVMEYAGLNECSNIFGINIRDRREKFLQLVPLAQEVEISRRLPGTIELRVIERVPIARIEMKGYFLSVDRDGRVLGPTTASRLPVIVGHGMPGSRPGLDLKDTRVMEAIEVLIVCDTSPVGRSIRIAQLDVKEKGEVGLKLAEGEMVRLAWDGMADRNPVSRADLEEKLGKVVLCLQASASRGKRIARLDMRLDRNIPAQEY